MDPGQTEHADPRIDMVTDLVWLERGLIVEIDGPQRIRETFRYSTPYGTREEEGA